MNLNHVEQLKILSVLGMAFVYFEVNIFQKITWTFFYSHYYSFNSSPTLKKL